MGRLTARFHGTPYCGDKKPCREDDCYDCPQFHDMLAKLAHYEDLEEAGRLVVLPEEFDKEKFIYSNCPSYILLEDHCHGDCKDCWEAALKGAE